ncbi:unnamed protein product [Pleuronectes platessa]|uniref:Uncharacterized protein n=1 Tax=Pleuronectes platessa TaxID=8262 RepID=A0A9N7U273_PLEPL|nr:unnamed protein product [Pleuronectes platessa]
MEDRERLHRLRPSWVNRRPKEYSSMRRGEVMGELNVILDGKRMEHEALPSGDKGLFGKERHKAIEELFEEAEKLLAVAKKTLGAGGIQEDVSVHSSATCRCSGIRGEPSLLVGPLTK